MSLLERQLDLMDRVPLMRATGRLNAVTGLTMTAMGLPAEVGSICSIHPRRAEPVMAQVVGFRDRCAILMPLNEPHGVAAGDRVTTESTADQLPVGRQMMGRVLDGFGRCIDGKGGFAVED